MQGGDTQTKSKRGDEDASGKLAGIGRCEVRSAAARYCDRGQGTVLPLLGAAGSSAMDAPDTLWKAGMSGAPGALMPHKTSLRLGTLRSLGSLRKLGALGTLEVQGTQETPKIPGALGTPGAPEARQT